MIERISFALLLLLSIPLAYNIVHASNRFGRATEAFDELEYRLGPVEFVDPAGPLQFTIDLVNGSSNRIDVIAVEFTLVADGSLVGGGSQRERTVIEPEGGAAIDLVGRINDQHVLQTALADGEVSWLVQARAQIQVDDDLDPTWQNFSFRTVTR